MIVVPLAERPLEQALAVGPTLLAEGGLGLALTALRGPSVILGAHQYAARVVDGEAAGRHDISIARRATAGTAMYAGGRALLLSLALPRVNSLFPDASYRSLLNRNVRPILRGLTSAGVEAHYFGREWVSAKRRAVVVMGFDVTRGGAVLIEALMGMDEPVSIPALIASSDERAVERYKGHPPAALAELARGITIERAAEALIKAFGACAGEDMVEAPSFALMPFDTTPLQTPPPGASLREPVRIPIGWLERARLQDGSPWLGGDVIAPRHVLDALAASEPLPGDVPIEGARAPDVLAKVHE